MNPNQTAPKGAVWSGFIMFAILANKVNKQMTIVVKGENIGLRLNMGLDVRKPVYGGLQTIPAQTSLRICAVWSAPLLFAFGEFYM